MSDLSDCRMAKWEWQRKSWKGGSLEDAARLLAGMDDEEMSDYGYGPGNDDSPKP